MVNDSDKFTEQLTAFSHKQLENLNTSDISRITTHLIISTAFFTGATIFFARQLQATKPVYLAALKQLLVTSFGMAEKNAAGLIESNARMFKRYKLIENAYNTGWRSAQDWSKTRKQNNDALHSLLKKYHNLSMSNLDIEGIKEEKAEATTVEEIAPIAAEQVTSKPTRRLWPKLFWLLILALLAGLSYALLFPQQIPPELREVLQPLRDMMVKLLRN